MSIDLLLRLEAGMPRCLHLRSKAGPLPQSTEARLVDCFSESQPRFASLRTYHKCCSLVVSDGLNAQIWDVVVDPEFQVGANSASLQDVVLQKRVRQKALNLTIRLMETWMCRRRTFHAESSEINHSSIEDIYQRHECAGAGPWKEDSLPCS